MLNLVDQHVLDLLHEELMSALETRFGPLPEMLRLTVLTIDDFDGLEWLIDRAETDDTLMEFTHRILQKRRRV